MADERNTVHRSGCPINLAVEVMGDRWSLVVLRDVMFGDRHYFRELQAGSQEGIASNILADRLRRLVAHGLCGAPPTNPPPEDPLQPHRSGRTARAGDGGARLMGSATHAGQP